MWQLNGILKPYESFQKNFKINFSWEGMLTNYLLTAMETQIPSTHQLKKLIL